MKRRKPFAWYENGMCSNTALPFLAHELKSTASGHSHPPNFTSATAMSNEGNTTSKNKAGFKLSTEVVAQLQKDFLPKVKLSKGKERTSILEAAVKAVIPEGTNDKDRASYDQVRPYCLYLLGAYLKLKS